MHTPNLRPAAAAALIALALTACGGGGGHHDGPDPLDAVPPSASADSGGFIAYLRALVALQPEDREPVTVDAVTPPAADTVEPEPVS